MIVFDEFLHGETIDKRDYVDENHLVSECTYLARYLLECGEKEEQVKLRLKDILEKSKIVDYRSLNEDIIKKSIKNAKARKCRKFTELVFYKEEIDKVKSFKTIDIQKIAFAYLTLSKAFGEKVIENKADVMRLVNVNYSGTRFREIINILTNAGFMDIDRGGHNYKKAKIRTNKATYIIKSLSNEGKIDFVMRDYRNIAGTFMAQIGNPTFRCVRCGGIFEKNKSTSIFCKECGKQNKLEKDRERYKSK